MKKSAGLLLLVGTIALIALVVGNRALRSKDRLQSDSKADSGAIVGKLASPASTPAQLASAAASPASEVELEDLANRLARGGSDMLDAAQKLVAIGSRDSIRTLVLGLLKMEPTRESMGIIYGLHEFPDPMIAEWIAELFTNTPQDENQFVHYNMLTALAGAKATPEALSRIAQFAQAAPTDFDRGQRLQIIAQAGSSDATPILMTLAQTKDLVSKEFDSVDFAALTALALQGRPEGVEFLFEQFAADSDPVAKSLRAQAIGKIAANTSVPLLIEVAKGESPSLADSSTRGVAMGVLSKMDDENAWHTLRDLKDNSDPDISYLAGRALDKLRARTGYEFE